MKKAVLASALILTAATAQETRNIEYRKVQTFTTTAGQVEMHGGLMGEMPGPGTFLFARSDMAFDGPVVKGAPYAADAITEMTQSLADGNRIHHTTTATLYRDSEGRTRREQTLGEMGPLLNSGEPLRTIVITDPVAGTTYMMDSRNKVAHKMPAKVELGNKVMAEMKARAEHDLVRVEGDKVIAFSARSSIKTEDERKNLKTESLGTQMIEGVAADGTRTTMTIPAGAIGNEQPIQVVTERWYSSQLKTTVMTKTIDPRMGETVYKLQNIRLGEPDAGLFSVPADYSTKE